MQNLTDRDMGYDILYGTKSAAHTYMEAVLESASPRCREIFHRLHDDCLHSHWRVWQFLHQRQEYRVQQAAPQELEEVRQRMSHLCDTHGIGARQAVGVGAQSGRWESEGRISAHHGSGRWTDGREGGRWEAPGTLSGNRPDRWADGRDGGRWDQPEGRWSEGRMSYARQGEYGTAGSMSAGATGDYATTGSTGGVNFEPDRNLPEGTRFESDRGFAEPASHSTFTAGATTGTGYGATGSIHGDAGSTYGGGTAYGGSTYGGGMAFGGTGTSYGSPSSGQWNEPGGRAANASGGTAGTGNWNDRETGRAATAPGSTAGTGSWNDRESGRAATAGRMAGTSIGARPSESSRRSFGESTWSSDETRKSGRY